MAGWKENKRGGGGECVTCPGCCGVVEGMGVGSGVIFEPLQASMLLSLVWSTDKQERRT